MIVIKHVNIGGIFTPLNISCKEFDRSFSLDMEYDTIVDIDDILCIYEYLEQFKEITISYCDTLRIYHDCMDTRAKMQIYTTLSMMEICIDNGTALYNNCHYKIPFEFIDYLNDMLKPVIIKIPKRKNRIR
jgi:hypothetical protein